MHHARLPTRSRMLALLSRVKTLHSGHAVHLQNGEGLSRRVCSRLPRASQPFSFIHDKPGWSRRDCLIRSAAKVTAPQGEGETFK